MRRVQVTTQIRFIAPKTGELVWETTVDGIPPRECRELEDFGAQGDTIRGNPPNVVGVYDEHFRAR